ncbi:[PSI+] inducibility protein 3 [Nakaseomyces bracarensis]|uniref:[PSI+] inducibility protein 3 n=1 Tax=Nakaseomyces bracarensis TaxID=273131 RepID=A0ABR4NZ02_9SACH
MSSAIKRSLNNIRNELDFLRESNVITEGCYKEILMKLPNESGSPHPPPPPVLEYVEALYNFEPQQDGDLALEAGDKIQVLEKPSAEWYRGRLGNQEGMFPSNYVKPASPSSLTNKAHLAPPSYEQQKMSPQVTAQSYQAPPPQPMSYSPQPVAYQVPTPMQPIPTQQYYQAPPQQVVEQPQQHHSSNSAFKSFGSKLGNAAIFGAGATLGGDLVNSIF